MHFEQFSIESQWANSDLEWSDGRMDDFEVFVRQNGDLFWILHTDWLSSRVWHRGKVNCTVNIKKIISAGGKESLKQTFVQGDFQKPTIPWCILKQFTETSQCELQGNVECKHKEYTESGSPTQNWPNLVPRVEVFFSADYY